MNRNEMKWSYEGEGTIDAWMDGVQEFTTSNGILFGNTIIVGS